MKLEGTITAKATVLGKFADAEIGTFEAKARFAGV